MIFTETLLKGSYVVELNPFTEFSKIGFAGEWLQMNHSFTKHKATIRGMHFQLPPFSEIKLVRCIAGAVYDVIIDLRTDSPTFLQWFGVELSVQNKKMIYIPLGFAHGFQALSDDCELIYHHSQFYTPGAEGGIKYNDPRIGINWPLAVTNISERDNQHSLLDENFKGI
jgi:dTDP-4-dehydrorhamnose 3,5-epimerase